MKYDIEALKRKMLVKYPFFGSVVTDVRYKECEDILIAGTDGETIYYNPEDLEDFSVEEQTFVFAHEVCHIAFNHILRSEGKDFELWNIATDAVINQFLKRDGLKIIEGGIDMAEAIDYDAEQLYEKLLQEKKKKQNNQSKDDKQNNLQNNNKNGENQNSNGTSQGDDGENRNKTNKNNEQSSQDEKQNNSQRKNQQQNSNGQSNDNSNDKSSQEQSSGSLDKNLNEEESKDAGHDTHSMWKEAVKKHKNQEEKDLSSNQLEKNKDKTELEKKQEKMENMGEREAFKKNICDRKKQLEELKEAILKQASQAGMTTNESVRTVSKIGRARPIVDWRYILKETIKYDVDWSYKNASIEDGVVVSNLEEQPLPETEIVLDTSGSIDEVLLKNFLRECKNILQYTKLKVGCFDVKFYGFYEIKTEEDIEKMRFIGGGGTDFNAAVNAFSKRCENKIIFTDGEASMPRMPIDAIWMVFGNRYINPKGGRVIHITSQQLDDLYNKVKVIKR